MKWKPLSLHESKKLGVVQLWRAETETDEVFTWTSSIAWPPDPNPLGSCQSTLRKLKLALDGKESFFDCPPDRDEELVSFSPVGKRNLRLDETGERGVYFHRRIHRWVPVIVVRRKSNLSEDAILLVEDLLHPDHYVNNPDADLRPEERKRERPLGSLYKFRFSKGRLPSRGQEDQVGSPVYDYSKPVQKGSVAKRRKLRQTYRLRDQEEGVPGEETIRSTLANQPRQTRKNRRSGTRRGSSGS